MFRQIDRVTKDVTHKTNHSGNPQTLECTKTRASHAEKEEAFTRITVMKANLKSIVQQKVLAKCEVSRGTAVRHLPCQDVYSSWNSHVIDSGVSCCFYAPAFVLIILRYVVPCYAMLCCAVPHPPLLSSAGID